MERPPSHDLSEYKSQNLNGLSLSPEEEELRRNGWQCVRIYPSEQHNDAQETMGAIQAAGADAKITYYAYTANEVYEGTMFIDDEKGQRTGARVWMRLPS